MKKISYVALALVIGSLALPAHGASAAYGRWYAGVKTISGNYSGIHSTMTAPSSMPKIVNESSLNVSMSLDWIEATGRYRDGTLWWVQTGYTLGYDAEASGSPYYTSPKAFVEWGPSNNLSEYVYGTQPFGSSWDYWVRWDNSVGAWKVNINNLYTSNFMYNGGGETFYPATVDMNAEINNNGNGNGPARFASNTYQSSANGSWISLSNDSYFSTFKDTGYSLTGTVNDFTVTK